MEFLNPWLSLVGLVLPLLVAAVTKSRASSAVKGWTLAALSGVAALIAELVESGLDFSGSDWREILNNVLLVFATGVIAYKGGLVRPAAREIAAKTADTGIGKPDYRRDPDTGRFAA